MYPRLDLFITVTARKCDPLDGEIIEGKLDTEVVANQHAFEHLSRSLI